MTSYDTEIFLKTLNSHMAVEIAKREAIKQELVERKWMDSTIIDTLLEIQIKVYDAAIDELIEQRTLILEA
jgi:multisubunit Na+/H+ antiporter MnhB subunit